jgi:hypothetical protein
MVAEEWILGLDFDLRDLGLELFERTDFTDFAFGLELERDVGSPAVVRLLLNGKCMFTEGCSCLTDLHFDYDRLKLNLVKFLLDFIRVSILTLLYLFWRVVVVLVILLLRLFMLSTVSLSLQRLAKVGYKIEL